MVSSKEESVCKFDKLYKHKRLSSVEADGANTQYDDFLRSICVLNYLFLGVFMNKKSKFNDLWKVCKLIFVLSHGQSQSERGFNINKEMLIENLEEKSLIGQRLVYDHMSSIGTKIEDFTVSNKLALSCNSANAKYTVDLEEKRAMNESNDKTNKQEN